VPTVAVHAVRKFIAAVTGHCYYSQAVLGSISCPPITTISSHAATL